MAALNAELGIKTKAREKSPGTASSVLFSCRRVLESSNLVLRHSRKNIAKCFNFEVPIYFYLGGGFVLFSNDVLNIDVIWMAPVFGVANAIAFVLLGQLIRNQALFIHYGFRFKPLLHLDDRHEPWHCGVRVGPLNEDYITAFIPGYQTASRGEQGTAGEGVAVDEDGNVFAAEGSASLPLAGGAFIDRTNTMFALNNMKLLT